MFKRRHETYQASSQINKRSPLFLKILGVIFITSGFLIVAAAAWSKTQKISPPVVSIQSEVVAKEDTQEKQFPKRILIPNLNIDVAIKEAEIKFSEWEIYDDVASYGLGSGTPGNAGNAVVFAHARKGLFLSLMKAQKGDQIYILMKDKWFTYVVESTKEVLPSDISVIEATEDETLTLYTCTGWNNSKRFIVVAKRG